MKWKEVYHQGGDDATTINPISFEMSNTANITVDSFFSRESVLKNAVGMDQKTEVENPLSIQNPLNDSQRDTSQAASNTRETSSQDNKVLMKNRNFIRPKNNALEKKLAKSQI